MATVKGNRAAELDLMNKIDGLGGEGQLSYVSESWAHGTSPADDDDFVSEALVMQGEGQLIEAKFSTSQEFIAKMQYRERSKADGTGSGTFGDWTDLIAADASAKSGERVTTLDNANIASDALGSGTQFRVVITDANSIAVAGTIKAVITYCNI